MSVSPIALVLHLSVTESNSQGFLRSLAKFLQAYLSNFVFNFNFFLFIIIFRQPAGAGEEDLPAGEEAELGPVQADHPDI